MRKFVASLLALQLVVAPGFGAGNAEAAENSGYVVISNESTDELATQSTGTISFKVNKSQGAEPYKIDVNRPFDPSSAEGKVIQKNTKSILASYKVGDRKDFWVSNLSTNVDYRINARLAYSGSKANVWVYNNQITDADAAKLGAEFDGKIHPSVTTNFGPESDVNADGKVNILCYDIQDGFNGNGGYVAGYFWAGDLYNAPYSNQSEIFYIDTYPTMGLSSKDVSAAYETLAHEFQHMVNHNQNVFKEGGAESMDTWLDEALSMAAEQIYSGRGLVDRIEYYNVSESIRNGHSLLYWDQNGDTLANYSLSYLFGQYIKIQAGQGNRIFKEILQDTNNNYKAVENTAKKYISPDMTFGKLMTHFRLALLLKEPTGLNGFRGDPLFNSLEKRLFTGTSANLRGGGAVVTTFDTAGTTSIPVNKGGNISYTFVGDKGVIVIDHTAPDKPIVNGVTDKDTGVTGQAEPGSVIQVRVGTTLIGSGVAGGNDGKFTVSIPVQPVGASVRVTATDAAGNTSEETVVVVKSGSLKGWVFSDGQWYYYDSMTGKTVTGWFQTGGKWYYFDSAGIMQTGWELVNGKWYYLESSGAMKSGWLNSGSKWYYLGADGAMKTGWLLTGGKWYFLDDTGAMKIGWLKTNGVWYYLGTDGAMKTGWLQSGSKWYYLDSSGAMKTGWVKVGTKWYYFYNDGSMAANTTIGGYRLGNDGAWIQ